MNILSIAQVDMSATEAGVVHVLDIARAMRGLGEEVSVAAISEGPPIVKEDWLRVYTIPRWANFWLLKGIICNLIALWIIINAIRGGCEAIYARHSFNFTIALRIVSVVKKRIPVWLEINGIARDEEEHIKRPFWHFGRIYAARLLERIAYKSASKYICVTPKIADYVCERYGMPRKFARVVPNGVDTAAYRPMDKGLCRKTLGLEPDAVYVGFIGNFLAWQGIDTFLEALPHVMKKFPRVRALVVGHGQYFEEYTELAKKLGIADKVRFPGYVHKDVAPLWINSFDIGLVLKKPITSGYSPLKLYSYMACGVAVVATDTEGFEPVLKYNAGILVPHADMQALVRAIEKLIADEGLIKECGKNGRVCAEENFSWEAAAKKILYDEET